MHGSCDDCPDAAGHGSLRARRHLPRLRPPALPAARRRMPSAASTELVSALASALRSADSRRASDRRDNSQAPAAGPGKSDASTEFAHGPTWRRGERRTDVRRRSASGYRRWRGLRARDKSGFRRRIPAATPATVATIAPMLAFRGSRGVRSRCKDANRANGVPRWKGRPTRTSWRRSTTIFRCIATATERENPVLAAATPPPAVDATPLTPTKAAYVQAWMKASRHRR